MPPAPPSQEGKGAPVWLVLDEVMILATYLSNVIVGLTRICLLLLLIDLLLYICVLLLCIDLLLLVFTYCGRSPH